MSIEKTELKGVITMAENFTVKEPLALLNRRGIDGFASAIRSDHPVSIQDSTGSVYVLDPNAGRILEEHLYPQMEVALEQQKKRQELLHIYYQREERRKGFLGKIKGHAEDCLIRVRTGRDIIIDRGGNIVFDVQRFRF